MSETTVLNFVELAKIARRCWQTSEDKGWHRGEKFFKGLHNLFGTVVYGSKEHEILSQMTELLGGERNKGTPVMEKLMLISTEVAEAAEAYRDSKMFPSLDGYYIERDGKTEKVPIEAAGEGKPVGFGSELADVVIRVFDLAESLGIDIAYEISRKMQFNEKRTYRHGGKVA